MKLLRRGTALLLSVALVFSLFAGSVLVGVVANSIWNDATSLGLLSRYYETGKTNTDAQAAAMISTVQGDIGGKSYGAYMFASNTGTVKDFINWCRSAETNTVTYAIGDKLHDAYYSNGEGCGPLFDQAWTEISVDYASAFFTTQESYVKSKIYDAAISSIRAQVPSFNVDNYSVALKNVIWSRAVHHGPSGACNIVVRAFNALGGFANQAEGDLIMAIYNESGRVVDAATLASETKGGTAKAIMHGTLAGKYNVDDLILRYWYGSSAGVQLSVYRRLAINEPSDALSMLQSNAFANALLKEGSYTIHLKQDSSSLALGVNSGSAKLMDTDISKFSLQYLSGAGAYTINTVVTNEDDTTSTLRLAADTLGTDGFGAVALKAPSTSDTQLWYVVQEADGLLLKNKATGTYLTYKNDTLVTVSVSDAAEETPADEAATEEVSVPENTESSDAAANTENTDTSTETTPPSDTSTTVLPSVWEFKSVVEEMSDWTVLQHVYPDENTELHKGDSGFPVRGMLSCSGTISNVTLSIKNSNGVVVSSAYKSVSPNASFYDLSDMDSNIAYSKLEEGEYTYTLTAKVNNKTFVFAESSFSVDEPIASEEPSTGGSDASFTVTFDAGENGKCSTVTKTYSLDSVVYGSLPSVTPNSGWGFAGWFTEAGEQILPGTQIVAEDITLYAQYTKVYTYTFLNASSGSYSSGSTAAGTLFDAPNEAPVKKPDSQYTYTFSHWVDEEGNKYSSGETIVMSEGDMSFTPVYNKAAKPSGGTTTPDTPSDTPSAPTPSGTYWVLTPGTSVSQIDSTVYSGNTVVTSGRLATGMTTTIDGVEYTFSITGDLSGDGKISVTDVVRLQSHLLNKTPLKGAYLVAAELNNDEKVTITDLVKCARVVAGKDTIG